MENHDSFCAAQENPNGVKPEDTQELTPKELDAVNGGFSLPTPQRRDGWDAKQAGMRCPKCEIKMSLLPVYGCGEFEWKCPRCGLVAEALNLD